MMYVDECLNFYDSMSHSVYALVEVVGMQVETTVGLPVTVELVLQDSLGA